MGMSLALRIMIHPTEVGATHQAGVLVVGEDGERAAELAMAIPPPPEEIIAALARGEELAVPVVINLSAVGLKQAGAYNIEVLVDGIHQASVPFLVKEGLTL
jgi:hypothetical protein